MTVAGLGQLGDLLGLAGGAHRGEHGRQSPGPGRIDRLGAGGQHETLRGLTRPRRRRRRCAGRRRTCWTARSWPRGILCVCGVGRRGRAHALTRTLVAVITRGPRSFLESLACAPMTDLRHSPLHDRHLALGAKLADFGGWEMPIDYGAAPAKLGVVAEHTAVRTAVGIFDVTHLGKLSVTGPGARRLRRRLPDQRPRPGSPRARRSTACAVPTDGGVVDDLIVYLRADDDLLRGPERGELRDGRRAARGRRPGRGHRSRPAHRLRRARRAGPAAPTTWWPRSACPPGTTT